VRLKSLKELGCSRLQHPLKSGSDLTLCKCGKPQYDTVEYFNAMCLPINPVIWLIYLLVGTPSLLAPASLMLLDPDPPVPNHLTRSVSGQVRWGSNSDLVLASRSFIVMAQAQRIAVGGRRAHK
jgi:hypothetical protein